MGRKITVTGANIVFFVFTILFLLFQILLAGIVAIFGEHFLDDNIYGILLINQYVIILVPVVVYTLYKRLDVREVFRLKPLRIPEILIILCLAFPAQLVGNMLNTIVVYGLQFLGKIPSNPIPVPHNYAELAVGVAVVAVSPAICEELLHRGIMLKAYENRGSMKAVAITSIFFGIFHFDVANFLGVIFLGFVIGYYVIRTNSIFAGMLAHFLNNLIFELMQFFSKDRLPPDRFISVTQEELVSSVVYGLAGFVVVALLLAGLRRITEGRCVIKPPISSVGRDIASVISHWPVILVLVLYILMAGLFFLTIILSGNAAF